MESTPLVLEAIARKTCVTGTYNGVRFKLAPYILYTRNGGLYMDAVALLKNDEVPQELKLGTFRLDGIRDLAGDDQRFEPLPLYDSAAPKYAGKLFAVEGWPE
jgi:hypothetical protein